MTWIKTIPYEHASGRLKTIYEKVKGPNNNVDNILMSHSLRPHTLEGHMAIYKYVLHHSGNTIPKWFLETIGVYVSSLNKCTYCVDHHYAGLKRLLNNEEKSKLILSSLTKDDIDNGPFDKSQKEALKYSKTLALFPGSVTEELITNMRNAGLDDGQILEINQVVSYFCYANRTVLGLGCNTDGDILGLSPSNSENINDWSHK